MKNLLASICLLAHAALACAATTLPVQLLNPTGSTAGQTVISNGPSSAPAWGAVTLNGLTGTLAVANGGTGATTQAAALSNLLGASTVPIANGGTAATSASAARTNLGLGTSAVVNTGTSGATIPLLNAANTWAAAQTFSVRPTFNGATPYDSSNLTIANYAPLASPTFTGTVTTAALTTTGLITPSSTVGIKGTATNDNAQAGSIGEYVESSTSSFAISTGTTVNITSITLTAGDWDVFAWAGLTGGTSTTSFQMGFSTTSASYDATPGRYARTNTTFTSGGMTLDTMGRLQLTSTTTVYLIASGAWSGTNTAAGIIRARRVR